MAVASPSPATAATSAPAWRVQALAVPTNFEPGDQSGKASYQAYVTNGGGAATDHSQITIVDTLPAGAGVKSIVLTPPRQDGEANLAAACGTTVAGEVSTVTCKVTDALLPDFEPAKLYPGNSLQLTIGVAVPAGAGGTLTNEVSVEGGAAEALTVQSRNPASSEDAAAGFEALQAELTGPDGSPATGAASHPYQYTTSFAVNTVPGPEGGTAPFVPAGGDLKEIEVALPPGLVGNPTATARCSAQQFNTVSSVTSPLAGGVLVNECPAGSALGLVGVQQLEGKGSTVVSPLYSLIPPRGMPAQLGFQILGAPIYINTKLRGDGDYGVSAYLSSITEAQRITAARITVWGTPADPSHDTMRGECAQLGAGSCPANLTQVRPFMRLPSSCENPLLTRMSFETWAIPSASAGAGSTEAPPSACEQPDFSPTIEAKPTTDVADSPSGLRVNLHLPQKENEDPEGVGEADLRGATVTLPPGLVVNPAAADGLSACSLAQIGYQGIREGRPSFSAAPAECPDAAKIGTVEVDTPLLDQPLPGSVYVAAQNENPFGALLAIYAAFDDPRTGIALKLAAAVEADPDSGRLTATFEDVPQFPIEDFGIEFFQGSRSVLRTPPTCATFVSSFELTPWTGPASGASLSDSFAPTASPAGGSCPTTPAALPNSPSFTAATLDPRAGIYSPFVLRVARPDGSQPFAAVDATLPAGVTARLAGIPDCPPARIALAESRAEPGRGALERQSPACPAASQVGSVGIAAGAGDQPLSLPGKLYLAGPYRRAPVSLLVVAPALTGPFDLGAVVRRIALYVDPTTARLRAVSDPLPTILSGIQLDLRSLRIDLDRPGLMANPTSCAPSSVEGKVVSALGSTAPVVNRFQVGDCSRLGFEPRVSIRLFGSTHRGAHPRLRTVLTSRPGDANIRRVAVTLPATELLDNRHIATICTRAQFAASQCPSNSIYGHAKAWTPLLDRPLEGPIYLRASDLKLPELVASLKGRIELDLKGRIDSVRGRLRSTFQALPDAPLSKVVLTMQGDRRGLLVNTGRVCARKLRVSAGFKGQNGKTHDVSPAVRTDCAEK